MSLRENYYTAVVVSLESMVPAGLGISCRRVGAALLESLYFSSLIYVCVCSYRKKKNLRRNSYYEKQKKTHARRFENRTRTSRSVCLSYVKLF